MQGTTNDHKRTERMSHVISLAERRAQKMRRRRTGHGKRLKQTAVAAWFATAMMAAITVVGALALLSYRYPATALPVIAAIAFAFSWGLAGKWLAARGGRKHHPSSSGSRGNHPRPRRQRVRASHERRATTPVRSVPHIHR